MTWIRVVPPAEADADLRRAYDAVCALYPPEYADPVAAAGPDSIVAAHSLAPEAMRHMMSGLAEMLRPTLPLTRAQQEMIAAVVSATNGCFY